MRVCKGGKGGRERGANGTTSDDKGIFTVLRGGEVEM